MKIMPRGAKRDIAAATVAALEKYGPMAGLTDMGMVYMLAQMAHESAYFKTMEEYASGRAYEGNRSLGNTEPGDGPRYKGRGPIQVTGRYNYEKINGILKKFGVNADIVENPYAVATNYMLGATVSIAWMLLPGNGPRAVRAANAGDIRALTKAINGGYNGLQSRIDITNKILNSIRR
jgi:putative chitinase